MPATLADLIAEAVATLALASGVYDADFVRYCHNRDDRAGAVTLDAARVRYLAARAALDAARNGQTRPPDLDAALDAAAAAARAYAAAPALSRDAALVAADAATRAAYDTINAFRAATALHAAEA